MENEVRDTIFISIEMLLAASVIALIALFGLYGTRAVAVKQQKNDVSNYMQAMDDLYYYNNRAVNYSDVVEIILTKTDTYDWFIVNGEGTVVAQMTSKDATNWTKAQVVSGSHLPYSYWSTDYIKSLRLPETNMYKA